MAVVAEAKEEQSGSGGALADRWVAAATSQDEHAWGSACEAEVALHWALGSVPTPASIDTYIMPTPQPNHNWPPGPRLR